MYIVAIGWIYVVLMMSITEHSVIAGLMTFLLYGVFPLAIILYLMDAPRRKRNRLNAEQMRHDQAASDITAPENTVPEKDNPDTNAPR